MRGAPGRKRGPKSNPKGAEKVPRLILTVPPELRGLTEAAAKQDGVTLAEWWRAAACGALLLRAQERAAWTGLLERQGAAPLAKSIRVTQRPGVSYRLPGDADPDEVTVPRGTKSGGGGE